jgi:ABC-type transporter Mla maintaining outer membrane lipid asymmetry ATPase subunit MlaF
MIVGTVEEIVNSEHPWIREYFHGERGRALRGEAGTDG